MLSTTPPASTADSPNRWRFSIRTLLLVILVASCLAGLWHWQSERHLQRMIRGLSQQEHLLQPDQGGDEEFVARFRIEQLVRHRSFRSSGLYSRILATTDGFGEFQLRFTNIAEFESHNREQVCLTFLDHSGPPSEVVIVAEPNGKRLTWIEINPSGESRWTSKLESTPDGKLRAVITFLKRGQLFQQVYRLSPDAIELIENRPVPDKAASEAELIRAMGIDSEPRGNLLPGLEGPESDLQ